MTYFNLQDAIQHELERFGTRDMDMVAQSVYHAVSDTIRAHLDVLRWHFQEHEEPDSNEGLAWLAGLLHALDVVDNELLLHPDYPRENDCAD